jgi:glycosyltransferase involved in cell wall biosynthesis
LRQTVAPNQDKIILFAGRLTPQKGITALFKAAEIVIREYPHVRYLLVGEPDYPAAVDMLDSLKQKHRRVMEKTKLLGKLPREQVALLYQIADLAVVPSVYEPFGYAATEAMAAGVPIVATRVGGLAEIIEDARSGLLVPVFEQETGLHEVDVEALALAQLRVLRDEALAQRLSAAGQERVRTKFSLERMVSGTLTVYRQALAQHQEKHALSV